MHHPTCPRSRRRRRHLIIPVHLLLLLNSAINVTALKWNDRGEPLFPPLTREPTHATGSLDPNIIPIPSSTLKLWQISNERLDLLEHFEYTYHLAKREWGSLTGGKEVNERPANTYNFGIGPSLAASKRRKETFCEKFNRLCMVWEPRVSSPVPKEREARWMYKKEREERIRAVATRLRLLWSRLFEDPEVLKSIGDGIYQDTRRRVKMEPEKMPKELAEIVKRWEDAMFAPLVSRFRRSELEVLELPRGPEDLFKVNMLPEDYAERKGDGDGGLEEILEIVAGTDGQATIAEHFRLLFQPTFEALVEGAFEEEKVGMYLLGAEKTEDALEPSSEALGQGGRGSFNLRPVESCLLRGHTDVLPLGRGLTTISAVPIRLDTNSIMGSENAIAIPGGESQSGGVQMASKFQSSPSAGPGIARLLSPVIEKVYSVDLNKTTRLMEAILRIRERLLDAKLDALEPAQELKQAMTALLSKVRERDAEFRKYWNTKPKSKNPDAGVSVPHSKDFKKSKPSGSPGLPFDQPSLDISRRPSAEPPESYIDYRSYLIPWQEVIDTTNAMPLDFDQLYEYLTELADVVRVIQPPTRDWQEANRGKCESDMKTEALDESRRNEEKNIQGSFYKARLKKEHSRQYLREQISKSRLQQTVLSPEPSGYMSSRVLSDIDLAISRSGSGSDSRLGSREQVAGPSRDPSASDDEARQRTPSPGEEENLKKTPDEEDGNSSDISEPSNAQEFPKQREYKPAMPAILLQHHENPEGVTPLFKVPNSVPGKLSYTGKQPSFVYRPGIMGPRPSVTSGGDSSAFLDRYGIDTSPENKSTPQNVGFQRIPTYIQPSTRKFQPEQRPYRYKLGPGNITLKQTPSVGMRSKSPYARPESANTMTSNQLAKFTSAGDPGSRDPSDSVMSGYQLIKNSSAGMSSKFSPEFQLQLDSHDASSVL